MRLQKLFVLALVLLSPFLFSSCINSCAPLGLPHGLPGKIAQVSDTTAPALIIEADIPAMRVDQEVLLAVSIYPTGGAMSVSDVRTVEKATPVVAQATPVGTPGSTLVNAFGPNHSAAGIATLETSPGVFSVTPTGPQTLPLDVNRVEWRWSVTPLLPGNQVIGVNIQAQWTSELDGKQSLPYTLGFPEFPVSVQTSLAASTSTPRSQPPTSNDNSAIPVAIIGGVATIIAAIIGFIATTNTLLARKARRASKPPAHARQEHEPVTNVVRKRRRRALPRR